jgi:hypothetical protein
VGVVERRSNGCGWRRRRRMRMRREDAEKESNSNRERQADQHFDTRKRLLVDLLGSTTGLFQAFPGFPSPRPHVPLG